MTCDASASVERKAKRREMEQGKKSLTPRVPQGTLGAGWADGVIKMALRKSELRNPLYVLMILFTRTNDWAINAEGVVDGALLLVGVGCG